MPSHPEISMAVSFSVRAIPTPALGADVSPSSTVPQRPPQCDTSDSMFSAVSSWPSTVGNLINEVPPSSSSSTLYHRARAPLDELKPPFPLVPFHKSNSAIELPSSVIPAVSFSHATMPSNKAHADKLNILPNIGLILFPCQRKQL